jgi:hypothetical protein
MSLGWGLFITAVGVFLSYYYFIRDLIGVPKLRLNYERKGRALFTAWTKGPNIARDVDGFVECDGSTLSPLIWFPPNQESRDIRPGQMYQFVTHDKDLIEQAKNKGVSLEDCRRLSVILSFEYHGRRKTKKFPIPSEVFLK